MSRNLSTGSSKARRRSLTCPCERCNEDLLTFDDDKEQSKQMLSTPEIGQEDDCPRVTMIDKTQCSFQKLLPQNIISQPGTKGTATWDGDTIYTANGWILSGGPILPIYYEYIKGIDLVKWFTENYVKSKQERETACGKEKFERDSPLSANTDISPTHKPKKLDDSKNAVRSPKKECSALLTLPAELRTAIYSYTVSTGRVLIYGNKPNKELAVLKKRWNPDNNPVHRPSYQLSHLLDNDDIYDGLKVSSSLLLVCKKIRKEVELFIYAHLRFCFDSMKVLHTFVRRASQEGLKAIRKLELHHSGYGEPKREVAKLFKQKHDRSWKRTCQLIAMEMPALEWLRLEVNICDLPVTLRREDLWFESLLDLVPSQPLKHVQVALAHNSITIGKDRLVRASRRVENHMMTTTGQRLRDQREKQRAVQSHIEHQFVIQTAELERLKSLPPVQAKRVLKITLNEKAVTQDTDRNLKRVAKKYYNSKTMSYANEMSSGNQCSYAY